MRASLARSSSSVSFALGGFIPPFAGDGMMDREGLPPEARTFLDGLRPELRPVASSIREAVLAAWPGLDEAIKWRRLTFTQAGNWHHWVCAIGASKNAVTLFFHKGALLSDPAGLLSGEGKYTRMIPGESFRDSDAEAFKLLVADAVQKQTLMLDGQ
jgi:hypothetical protein